MPQDRAELAGLVAQAVRAANSHNAQAWRFRAQAGGLTILPDPSRALPVADPDGHHLFASLGCAAENLALAAGAAGRPAGVAYRPGGGGAVEVALGRGRARADPLAAAIPGRQCSRSIHDGRPVPASALAALERAVAEAGCTLVLVLGRAPVEAVLELILAANAAQVSDPAFRAELLGWLRFNARAAAAAGDGLHAACAGRPALPGWLGRLLFRLAFRPGAENDRCARQVRSGAGLAVIVSGRDDAEGWVRAGRACQRFALQATALGIRHAHVNQPVEVAATRAALASLLGLGARPDLVLRFGHGPLMPRSLRRPVGAVLEP